MDNELLALDIEYIYKRRTDVEMRDRTEYRRASLRLQACKLQFNRDFFSTNKINKQTNKPTTNNNKQPTFPPHGREQEFRDDDKVPPPAPPTTPKARTSGLLPTLSPGLFDHGPPRREVGRFGPVCVCICLCMGCGDINTQTNCKRDHISRVSSPRIYVCV
jgi:hypothetical protein